MLSNVCVQRNNGFSQFISTLLARAEFKLEISQKLAMLQFHIFILRVVKCLVSTNKSSFFYLQKILLFGGQKTHENLLLIALLQQLGFSSLKLKVFNQVSNFGNVTTTR